MTRELRTVWLVVEDLSTGHRHAAIEVRVRNAKRFARLLEDDAHGAIRVHVQDDSIEIFRSASKGLTATKKK